MWPATLAGHALVLRGTSMEELNQALAPTLLDACNSGAAEAAAALQRALDAAFTIAPGEVSDLAASGVAGQGLILLLQYGASGIAIVLPGSLLPSWCASPDKSGESRLATLAQELSMVLAPESLAADSTKVKYCDDLAASLHAGGVAPDAAVIALPVASEERTGKLLMVWPLATPLALLSEAAGSTTPAAAAVEPVVAAPPTAAPPVAKPSTARVRDLSNLPGYSRSLLKIRVPVSVQLAAKKELLQEVIAMAPGSIIKFEKGCDQLLQLIVGERPIAEGEAVKIGEKFGFRVTSMLLPQEQFVPVRKGAATRHR